MSLSKGEAVSVPVLIVTISRATAGPEWSWRISGLTVMAVLLIEEDSLALLQCQCKYYETSELGTGAGHG